MLSGLTWCDAGDLADDWASEAPARSSCGHLASLWQHIACILKLARCPWQGVVQPSAISCSQAQAGAEKRVRTPLPSIRWLQSRASLHGPAVVLVAPARHGATGQVTSRCNTDTTRECVASSRCFQKGTSQTRCLCSPPALPPPGLLFLSCQRTPQAQKRTGATCASGSHVSSPWIF